jgi:Tol biopolymer transport system component
MKKFFLTLALFALPVYAFALEFSSIERVNLSDAGVETDDYTEGTDISPDGRYVVFSSYATNLVAGDTNDSEDVFVYDRDTDTVERVSIADDDTEGDADSYQAVISADGRYVSFFSTATTLVAGDTNAVGDIFVYDRDADTIERVSVTDAGVQGNGRSVNPSVSADGRYVAFNSLATNLVAGDTNAVDDVFVYDRDTDTIERVSVTDAGAQGNGSSVSPSVSADGRYVGFSSGSTNLVAGDTNAVGDIFVYDRDADTIERVSVTDAGAQGNGQSINADISDDGRYISFTSAATDLVAGDTNGWQDIFVYDRTADTIERVNVTEGGVQGDANSISNANALSPDGRYVVFGSDATNLFVGDTNGASDVFLYDRDENDLMQVSVNSSGDEGDNSAFTPAAVATDGLFVAFYSDASNFVAGDTNGQSDVFVTAFAPPDTDAPVITILGDNPATVTEGDAYTDAGATAEDDTDGDITADINTTNSVNTAVIGSYDVVYDVTDAADNTAYATRTVNVIEEESGGGGVSRRRRVENSSTGSGSNDSENSDEVARLQRLVDILTQILAFLMGQTTTLPSSI